MFIEPGTELDGKYRIIRLLGEGGMGAVYEAEHVHIARRVALKVLHPSFGRSEKILARFAGEARAAAAIGHEAIAQTLDSGTWRGLPFLVMELLRGETLADRLERTGTLPPREACRIAGHVLSALAAAHAAGIIHRDLKPENIFLVPTSRGADAVKLLDFGVSKFRAPGLGRRATTGEGPAVGTPGYMSPEQCMSRFDLDHRADLFSVGVTLYESLTSVLPYDGATPGVIFLEVVQGTRAPDPPSELAPRVPPSLDAIVLRAVARDRDARFRTAQAFLDALRPFGAEEVEITDAPPRASLEPSWALDPMPETLTPVPAAAPAAYVPAAPRVTTPHAAEVAPDEVARDTMIDPPPGSPRRHLLALAGVFVAVFVFAGLVRLVALRVARTAPRAVETAHVAPRAPSVAPSRAPSVAAPVASPPPPPTAVAVLPDASPQPRPAHAAHARRSADEPSRRGARRRPHPARGQDALDINREF